ncbi:DUF3592 domain-containing protein [Mucilaginibacter dorajii]|uniref:DUF3592 domain-containing protein n=1 Tax=Mucilaginibacter dorajii TaxID=692994 RepID=A0ABP7P1R3_9SPHI|nr:DUF3592 domain-containing protein [Mucilaginibacter dorajii]MCS3737055.1 hypothetical protein [Mucilaginibacter dorajii]
MNITVDEIILLTGGTFFTVWGIGKITERSKLVKTGVKVDGVVMENEYDGEGRDVGTYYPVIRYITLEKEWVTKRYEIGSSPPAFKERETVKVIYSLEDHEYFMIDNWHSKLLGPVFIIVGLTLIISVVIYFILHQY